MKRRDGSLFYADVSSAPLSIGKKNYLLGTFRDITERKNAEEKLADSEKQSSIWLANSPVCTKILDLDFNLQFMSETGVKQLNIEDITEYYGKPYPLDFYPDSFKIPMSRNLEEARATGETITQEAAVVDLNGNALWFHSTIVPVKDASGQVEYMMVISMETTERKRAEEERDGLEAQLRQSQKLESIGTFASGVAHEVNNPINGIMNYAQLIHDRLSPDNEISEFATEIGNECERVATIVRNLLSFARHDEVPRSPAGLCDIVESTQSLVSAMMRRDNIEFEVNVPKDLPQIMCGDQQIQQVLMNLMTNARDALNEKYPKGDTNKKLSIVSHTFKKEGSCWIRTTVTDSGIGIPEDVRERMFEPFFTTKPRHEGTGLGLSISHGIVKDHGGEFTMESKVGEWTRFHMDLPIADIEAEEASSEEGKVMDKQGMKTDA